MSLKHDILDIISKIDLELLKEQAESIENSIEWINSEIHLGCEEDSVERLEIDKSNLEGILELIDNLVCALEENDNDFDFE